MQINLNQTNQIYQNIQDNKNIESIKSSNYNNSDDKNSEKLKKACNEMESLFIYQLLKEMRKTIHKTKLIDGGAGEESFTSMMDMELAKKISLEKSLGISNILFEKFSKTADK